MDVADVLDVGRGGPPVDLERPVAVAELRLRADNPRIVVAEDPRVLLVSGGIAGDLAQLQMVPCVCRLQQNDAVLRIQPLFDALHGRLGFSGLFADACHDAHALGFDEDLTFFAFLSADHMAVSVESSAEPRAVPAGIQRRRFNLRDRFLRLIRFLVQAEVAADAYIGSAILDKHTRNEHALRHGSLAGPGDLEALSRVLREAVEVQAVVPVRAPDQRQAVRAEMCLCKIEAPAQMLHERFGQLRIVVEVDLLVQDAPVTGLAKIGVRPGNQPQRVVVEAAADRQIPLLGQGLILVIGAAVRELRRRDVQDALTRTLRNHMDKAKQILAGVTEAHASAHAAFEVAGAAAHVEGHHALVLVPDIDHAVELLVPAVYLIPAQKFRPEGLQRLHRPVECLIVRKTRHHGLRGLFVDHVRTLPLFLHGVLDISQAEHQAVALSRAQREVKLLRRDRLPAMGHAPGAAVSKDRFGSRRTAVNPDKGVAGCVKSRRFAVGPEDRVMISAFTVFGLMIDRRADDLHLTGGKVSLEVGRVVHRIPEAELHIREEAQRLLPLRLIGDRDTHQHALLALRHHKLLLHGDVVLRAFDHRVAQAVPAAVSVELCLNRLPAGIPYGISILYIKMKALLIQRAVVVAVARDSPQSGIAVEAVAAGRVAQQGEKVLISEVVDPRQRCARCCDDIFASLIIKMAVFHGGSPCS